jgi:hypothetical protein
MGPRYPSSRPGSFDPRNPRAKANVLNDRVSSQKQQKKKIKKSSKAKKE